MKKVVQKESLNVGVENSNFTFFSSETEKTATYENTTYSSPNIKNVKITNTGEGTEVTGSNTLYAVVWGSKSATLAMDLLAVHLETKSRLLGRKLEKTTNGINVSALTENGRPEKVGFTTECPNNDGTVVFVSFPMIQAMKEIEESIDEMGGGYSESAQTYEFKAMSVGESKEVYIITGPIPELQAIELAKTWHTKPPQTIEEAKTLIDALDITPKTEPLK